MMNVRDSHQSAETSASFCDLFGKKLIYRFWISLGIRIDSVFVRFGKKPNRMLPKYNIEFLRLKLVAMKVTFYEFLNTKHHCYKDDKILLHLHWDLQSAKTISRHFEIILFNHLACELKHEIFNWLHFETVSIILLTNIVPFLQNTPQYIKTKEQLS